MFPPRSFWKSSGIEPLPPPLVDLALLPAFENLESLLFLLLAFERVVRLEPEDLSLLSSRRASGEMQGFETSLFSSLRLILDSE